jgi:hypothetical protein
MKFKRVTRFIKKAAFAFVKLILLPFQKIADYTGSFAAVFKGFLVAAMGLIALSPFIVYTVLLTAAQSVEAPVSYILYFLWWAYLGSCLVFASLAGYLMETKGSSWVSPKSVDYEREKPKEQKAEPSEEQPEELDIDERVKKYLATLEKKKKHQ